MAKTPQDIQDINASAQEYITALNSVGAALKENAKALASTTGEAQEKSIVNTAKAKDLAKELKVFTKEQLADKRTLIKFENKINDTKGIQAGIEAEIQQLLQKRILTSEDLTEEELKSLELLTDARDTFTEIVSEAEKLKKELEEIDNEVQFFDDIAEFGKQIPGLSGMFGELGKAAEVARKAASEGGSAFLAGASQYVGAVGKLMIGFGISTFVKGIKSGQDRITSFSRELNVTREQADQINTRFVKLASTIPGITAKELAASTLSVSEHLGISAELSDRTAVNFAAMTGKLGLSVEQAAKLTAFTSATNQDLGDFNTKLIGTVTLQNAATDSAVRYQDVMKDVANTSAATQLTNTKFAGGLQRAAYEARKVGLNMMMLEKSASSLLNFESSIESELEAELLTGKELNLERARMAALTGDNATLAAELAKNFGTAEEFTSQNVLAQEAQAKAMGMTREELAETLISQQAMKNLGMDMSKSLDVNVKKRIKEIEALKEQGKLAEANAKEEKLMAEIGETRLGQQIKNRSLADRQAEATEKMADAVSTLAKPFDKIGEVFDSISTSAGNILGFIGKIGSKGKALGSFFFDMLKGSIDDVAKYARNFVPNILKALTKGGGSFGLKSLLKKIPVVGLLVGIGMAIKRFTEGDWVGGGLEIASGIASLFPGIGTGASMAIDAASAGRDIYKGRKKQEESEKKTGTSSEIVAEDFTIRTHPKDTLKIAGGTKFGEETNTLLKELITAVKSGGTVYMDGNKVGHTLALSTYKSN